MDELKKLGPKHLKCIQVLIDDPCIKRGDLAEMFGVSKTAMSKWTHSKIFMERLEEELRREWQDARRPAQKTLIDLAKKGDRKAAQYILDCMGYKPAEKIDVNTTVNTVKVTLTDEENQ